MRGLVVALVVTAAGTTGLFPHGASRGFHLHVSPDPATPGSRLKVKGAAPSPLTTVRLGLVDGPEVAERLDPPARRFTLEIEIPEDWKEKSASLQAEGRTGDGGALRASAVVRVERSTSASPAADGEREPQSAVRSLGAPCAR